MIKLSKTYNPEKVENKIYQLWLKLGFFNPDKLFKNHKKKIKSYTIVLPPPNITGELHMGHFLNAIVQDILIRQKRMQGYNVLWVPGIDHAGIATQNVVEKELKKQGKTRFDLGRKKFIKEIWKWKRKYGDIILDQLKKIGVSCDWSRNKFTMDENYCLAVQEAFSYYYNKKMIYQGKRIVNWCSRCQTSLSDLEIEHKEEKGHLWFIRYPLINIDNLKFKTQISKRVASSKLQVSRYITVATTRPETMLGDTAVAVNPKDLRYKNLIGQKVLLPLTNRQIPIIADSLVDQKFGTGAVKITPAHDLTDEQISIKHNLKAIQIINEQGRITKQAPVVYQGLKILEARQKIIEDLDNLNLLEKIEDYSHQIPKCYRCNNTIELIPSWQWFLRMDKLAIKAIKAVKTGKIKFYPKKWEKPYFEWLKNIKDWCISRQIWWGHRLPIWQCQIGKSSKFKVQNSKLIKENYFLSLKSPKKCLICKKCRPKQVDDVLDTWFSSALWPFAVLGWPKKAKNEKRKMKSDLERFYPTDVLSTDRGIINLWVARMIFSGMELVKKIPFRNVYIHPTVLTKEGKRMSKSLGTGIDPLNLINKYGADAVRFGIAYQITGGQDIRFTEDNIVMGKKFCNKLWNAARFILLQYSDSKLSLKSLKTLKTKNLTTADRKILNTLKKTIKLIDKDLKNFQFGKSAHTLYDFFWHDFCDKYIEESKKQLQMPKIRNQTLVILIYVLKASLKLLHPFIPFITEEIYQKLPFKNKEKFLIIGKWPE